MRWNARGYRSIVDYILTIKKLSPLVNNTKAFRGYNVSTDHYLVISKICLSHKWHTFIKTSPQQKEIVISKICLSHKWHTFIKTYPQQKEIFRVHLVEDPSIKLLHQRRLEQNLRHSPCSLNINEY